MAVTADCRNPDHAGEPRDICAGCARDRCEDGLVALSDRYQRLLNDQAEESRRTRAAARREAQDHMRAFAHLILPRILGELAGPIRPALCRATQVDPAMGRRFLDRSRLEILKTEAEAALKAWDERTSMTRLPKDFAADPREAEITRLRQVITTAGRRLHQALAHHQVPLSGPCQCPGCDLIRDMDTQGLPEPDLAGGT